MKIDTELLEELANQQLELAVISNSPPNYSNTDLINACIVFNALIMDKMWELQEDDNMPFDDRYKMAEVCGNELHKFIHTYTGKDIKKILKDL
jgi:hypothetical protein